MSDESKNPDLKVGDIRYDLDQPNRDNMEIIRNVLDNLTVILKDIDTRLKALGG
jgi:hypothetical protein